VHDYKNITFEIQSFLHFFAIIAIMKNIFIKSLGTIFRYQPATLLLELNKSDF